MLLVWGRDLDFRLELHGFSLRQMRADSTHLSDMVEARGLGFEPGRAVAGLAHEPETDHALPRAVPDHAHGVGALAQNQSS